MNKQDFLNTKWDAQEWSNSMRINWMANFAPELGISGNNDYYYISSQGSVHFNSDQWHFHNNHAKQKTYQDVFPEVTQSGDIGESNLAKNNPVTKPSHYEVVPDIEAKQIIELVLNSELAKDLSGYQAYCLGNILKYRLRAGGKDDIEQEINKANQYVKMGWN